MDEKKEIEKKQKTDVIDSSMFSGMKTGFEDTCSDSFKTPFLRILQSGSNEIKKKEKTYVSGAEEGMFYNPVTGKLYSDLEVIVLKITHNLVVWKQNRGGFVGVYEKKDEQRIVAKKDGLKKFDAEGNSINDTISFFCLDANNPIDLFVFPMSNTALKHARNFTTKIRMLELNGKPVQIAYAGVWKISTVLEENQLGKWYDIGSTPLFTRFITQSEFNDFIKPALSLIENSITDYSQSDLDSTVNVVDKETAY
jgi:hypothetical protein